MKLKKKKVFNPLTCISPLPQSVQEYYNRKLLRVVEEEKQEEKRLRRPLIQKDRVRMMIGNAVKRAALAEAFKDENT